MSGGIESEGKGNLQESDQEEEEERPRVGLTGRYKYGKAEFIKALDTLGSLETLEAPEMRKPQGRMLDYHLPAGEEMVADAQSILTCSNTVINGFITRDVGMWLRSLFEDLESLDGFTWCMTIEDTEERWNSYYQHKQYEEALAQLERAIPERIGRELQAASVRSEASALRLQAKKGVGFVESLSSRSFSKSDPPTNSSTPISELLDGETDGSSYRFQALSRAHTPKSMAGEEHELDTEADEELAEEFEGGMTLT